MHPEIERLIKERQDLEPILKFYDLVLERQESSKPDNLLPLIDFTKDSAKDRLTNSSPLIDASKITLLDLCNSIALFYTILELLKDISDLFRHLVKDIDVGIGRTDIEGTIRAVLTGDTEGLRRSAEKMGLSNDLLYFLIGLSLAPSLKLLSLKAQDNLDMDWWDEPFCPVCGQLPNMAQAQEKERLLSCSFCSMEWIYRDPGCPLCGTDDKKMVGMLRINGEDGYHLSICGNCNGYIKVIDRKHLPKELDNRIIDLISLPLDIIARQKGHKGPAPFPI